MPKSSYAKPAIFAEPRRSKKRAATSSRLVQQFRSVLATKPFERITLSELADALGIARTTVYRIYANTTEVLWSISRDGLIDLVRAGISHDAKKAREHLGNLLFSDGILEALLSPTARAGIKTKLSAIAVSILERQSRARCHPFKGTVVAGLFMDLFDHLIINGYDEEALSHVLGAIHGLVHRKTAAARNPQKSTNAQFPPAVSVAESLESRDHIRSMINGRPYRSLTRHIARYGFTAAQYRECFNLPPDYPLVAPSFSELRRELARRTLPKKARALSD